jgi:hypothetical protein
MANTPKGHDGRGVRGGGAGFFAFLFLAFLSRVVVFCLFFKKGNVFVSKMKFSMSPTVQLFFSRGCLTS